MMTNSTECLFCGGNTFNQYHSACAAIFEESLKKRLLEYCSENPGKPIPPEIQRDLEGKKWLAYKDHLQQIKLRLEAEAKQKKFAEAIQGELQKIADGKIRELDNTFGVTVSIDCFQIPTY